MAGAGADFSASEDLMDRMNAALDPYFDAGAEALMRTFDNAGVDFFPKVGQTKLQHRSLATWVTPIERRACLRHRGQSARTGGRAPEQPAPRTDHVAVLEVGHMS